VDIALNAFSTSARVASLVTVILVIISSDLSSVRLNRSPLLLIRTQSLRQSKSGLLPHQLSSLLQMSIAMTGGHTQGNDQQSNIRADKKANNKANKSNPKITHGECSSHFPDQPGNISVSEGSCNLSSIFSASSCI
jgi:hypothetical protein